MNILVIGNGFDLAHGLPTKYTDFLAFCKVIKNVYEVDERDTDDIEYMEERWKQLNLSVSYDLETFKKLFYELNAQRSKLERYDENDELCSIEITINYYWDKLYKNINNNIWVDYFLDNPIYQRENWVDFENEISKIIRSLDNDMYGKNFDERIDRLSNSFLANRFSRITYDDLFEDEKKDNRLKVSYREIRDGLYADLNKLIEALAIYLDKFVGQVKYKLVSPDIKHVINKSTRHEYTINGKEIFNNYYILCFNYTKLYEDLYQKCDAIDYIHGKADVNSDFNNMVLGIDEHLSDERKDKNVEFIAFKKFYQRIYKQTGCKYKEWVDEIRQDYFEHLQKIEDAKYKELQYIPDKMQRIFNKYVMSAIKSEKCPIHNLYIFGHSLDSTDGDILRDLILNDNVYTTIFYHNRDSMGQQIANLVKIIGQDELIRRTGGSMKTIEFKLQQDMVPIENA